MSLEKATMTTTCGKRMARIALCTVLGATAMLSGRAWVDESFP